jgi:hypothetical protein
MEFLEHKDFIKMTALVEECRVGYLALSSQAKDDG